MARRGWVTAALVGLLLGGWLSVAPEAQPFSAQIVRAFRYYGFGSPGVYTMNLTFSPDNTKDIGALGATRPRTVYAGTSVIAPIIVTGATGYKFSDNGGTLNFGFIQAPSDGVFLLVNAAGTDFSRLMFGGSTAAFPALKRSGTTLRIRLADDSADAGLILSTLDVKTSMQFAGATLISSAPTVTSAGTSPSVTGSNGSATFRVNVGTGGTATTIVLAMPAAATGWDCNGSNITAAAANRNPTGALLEQSSTTSSVTMQYQTVATGVALAFVASDIVQMSCLAF